MAPPHRISVALCTFNGERYLPAQLGSILSQTRLPDEVVICDDGSTDRTRELLDTFARDAPFAVHIHSNPANLGSTRNFERAIALCSGEFTVLCDQDDQWAPEKLALSEQAFEQEHGHGHGVGLVFSDATLITGNNTPVAGKTLWQHFGFGPAVRQALQHGNYLPCVEKRFVTGATATVRTNLAQRCLPAGEGWIHDEWLAAAIPLYADLVPLDTCLTHYRLHAAQQIGATRQQTLKDKEIAAISEIFHPDEAEKKHWGTLSMVARRTEVLCQRFAQEPLSPQGRERLQTYIGYARWVRFRCNLPPNRLKRARLLLQSRPVYRRYARLGSFAKDLLLPKRS